MCSWGNTTNSIAPIYIYKIFYMGYAYILYRISILIQNLGMELYIHRNTFQGEKDYGVDKNHIIDSVQRVI